MIWALLTMEFTHGFFFTDYRWEFSRVQTFPTRDDCESAIVEIHKTLPGLTMICKSEAK